LCLGEAREKYLEIKYTEKIHPNNQSTQKYTGKKSHFARENFTAPKIPSYKNV